MYNYINPIFKLLKPKKYITTSFVFRLQTKVTVFLLIMFSILLSAEQYFGKPIDCVLSNPSNANKRFLDNFCWTSGTYIYANATGKWVNFGGWRFEAEKCVSICRVVCLISGRPWMWNYRHAEPARVVLRYYQWTVLVLSLLASLFYLPALVWKMYERGLMEDICSSSEFHMLK